MRRKIIITTLFLGIGCACGCGNNVQEPTSSEAMQEIEDTTETTTEMVEQNEYTSENSIKEYVGKCSPLDVEYRDFIRYEGDYIGKDYVAVVQVSEVFDDGSIKVTYRDASEEMILNDFRKYDTTKILKDDVIRFYGKYEGSQKTGEPFTVDEAPAFSMYAADIFNEVTMPGADEFVDNTVLGEGEDDSDSLPYVSYQAQFGNEEDLYNGLDYAGSYDGDYNSITVSMYTSDIESSSDPVGVIDVWNKLQGGDTLTEQGSSELYHDYEAQAEWGGSYDALYTFTMDGAIYYIGLKKNGDDVSMEYFSLRSQIDVLKMTEHYVP